MNACHHCKRHDLDRNTPRTTFCHELHRALHHELQTANRTCVLNPPCRYGIIYGLTAHGLQQQLQHMNMTVPRAQELINSFLGYFKGVKGYIERSVGLERKRSVGSTRYDVASAGRAGLHLSVCVWLRVCMCACAHMCAHDMNMTEQCAGNSRARQLISEFSQGGVDCGTTLRDRFAGESCVFRVCYACLPVCVRVCVHARARLQSCQCSAAQGLIN